MNPRIFSIESAGDTITVEFSDLADQAHASVLVKCRDTVVFVSVVMSQKEKAVDYLPLTVDYEEKFYAQGTLAHNHRREGRPSDDMILTGRIIDRTIRPLFDESLRNEIQIIVQVLALGEYDSTVLAVLGTSLALGTSSIPWNGPVQAVRLQKNSNGITINPHRELLSHPNTTADVLICGLDGMINMIEVSSREVSNETITSMIREGLPYLEKLETFQKNIIKSIGIKKQLLPTPIDTSTLETLFSEHIEEQLADETITTLQEAWVNLVRERAPDYQNSARAYFDEQASLYVHREGLEKKSRLDGRNYDEIRPIFAQAGGISSTLHGSGTFFRGGTHVVSIVTLGGPHDSFNDKQFEHQYHFPPFSSGETGKINPFNRRSIGHGALVEKALAPVIPSQEIFPYTIRVSSECFASNGSTSMASTCASSIALMDAGVPITKPVAGISIGLLMKSTDEYILLTDIQGPEDHYGDMDFKVTGTRGGITAIQLDVKVRGITLTMIEGALEQAERARLVILEKMSHVLEKPRATISEKAPHILVQKIHPEQIGLIIGTGGKTIKHIQEHTGTEIDIDDDGTVFISGKNGSSEQAQKLITDILSNPHS